MGAKQFFHALQEVYQQIEETQLETICKVAQWGADAIAADRLILLFGSGHSFLATMDTFPRIGSYPGWLPIHELSTSYIATVMGNQGLRQTLYLEKIEGFGRLVLENYRLDPRDVMVVISNSGVNPMGIDVALSAREQGLKTVAITSLAHSQQSGSRHSTGKRLFEVCDAVIDTCVPQGDSLVSIAGFPHKVASASTIASCIIMQSLAAEVARTLAERGISMPVFPSHNAGGSEEQRAAVEKMIDTWYAEQARRTAGIYK
ncbi:MAG: SIS domain-containing protein [Ktedonobacteraceae bacterium]|nr:SIS domain-containing protein [Ktedonobacteraceae bacterium]